MPTDVPPVPAEREALDRRWSIWASVAIGTFMLVSLILGLVVLPGREEAGFNPFAAICRAIGIPGYQQTLPGQTVPRAARILATAPVSDVSWTTQTRELLANASAKSGAALAKETCAACHGENGVSVDPQQFPNLAGQSQAAMFKELRDFQTGARKSDIMTPIAQPLTQRQMAEVAAFYDSRASAELMVAASGVALEIGRLARQGDPARAIPSCDSCHGQNRSGPDGAPVLLGEPIPYLEQQLKNFASGSRGNDLYGRMRTIARQLTPDEMHRLAIYYSGMPR